MNSGSTLTSSGSLPLLHSACDGYVYTGTGGYQCVLTTYTIEIKALRYFADQQAKAQLEINLAVFGIITVFSLLVLMCGFFFKIFIFLNNLKNHLI